MLQFYFALKKAVIVTSPRVGVIILGFSLSLYLNTPYFSSFPNFNLFWLFVYSIPLRGVPSSVVFIFISFVCLLCFVLTGPGEGTQFLQKVCHEIVKCQEDGSLEEILSGILDHMRTIFSTKMKLMHMDLSSHLKVLSFFVSNSVLAEVSLKKGDFCLEFYV